MSSLTSSTSLIFHRPWDPHNPLQSQSQLNFTCMRTWNMRSPKAGARWMGRHAHTHTHTHTYILQVCCLLTNNNNAAQKLCPNPMRAGEPQTNHPTNSGLDSVWCATDAKSFEPRCCAAEKHASVSRAYQKCENLDLLFQFWGSGNGKNVWRWVCDGFFDWRCYWMGLLCFGCTEIKVRGRKIEDSQKSVFS